MPDDRSTRGEQTLKKIHADWGMPNVLSKLDDIAPDLKDMVRDFAFGDVYSRPGLDIKYRQLATVAVLAALSRSPQELKAHLHGALKLGWSKQELLEVLIQQVLYAGFPAAIHAVLTAKEVFAEHDAHHAHQAAPK
jgi:4-carboxymuconolactone decarboxylase